jgi:hypothetical protein
MWIGRPAVIAFMPAKRCTSFAPNQDRRGIGIEAEPFSALNYRRNEHKLEPPAHEFLIHIAGG